MGISCESCRRCCWRCLARDPSHGYELRARLALALGPLAGVLNEGQVYVTLGRLEKSGLVSSQPGRSGWIGEIAGCTS